MRIAEIIGTVTLNHCHPSLVGGTYRLAIPLTLEELSSDEPAQGESLVVFDELGAGIGSRIALSESREAAMPFHPETKPIDAYNAAILDHLTVEETT